MARQREYRIKGYIDDEEGDWDNHDEGNDSNSSDEDEVRYSDEEEEEDGNYEYYE